jgi:hypothetical protein
MATALPSTACGMSSRHADVPTEKNATSIPHELVPEEISGSAPLADPTYLMEDFTPPSARQR